SSAALNLVLYSIADRVDELRCLLAAVLDKMYSLENRRGRKFDIESRVKAIHLLSRKAGREVELADILGDARLLGIHPKFVFEAKEILGIVAVREEGGAVKWRIPAANEICEALGLSTIREEDGG
uniref:hypothetical protein n=1 Tax=Thermogemmatispora sp. TaxID=1968838 RepID=UPI0035E3F7E9